MLKKIVFFSLLVNLNLSLQATKKLEHQKELDLLNKVLEKKPVCILRMKAARDLAQKAIAFVNTLPDNQNKDTINKLLEYKTRLLKPVKDFFEPLYSYKSILQPLVEEILLADKSILDSIEKTKEQPILLLFFEVKKEDVNTYFDLALNDRKTILKACNEFEIMFEPIITNLSKEACDKADELVKKLNDKKDSIKK